MGRFEGNIQVLSFIIHETDEESVMLSFCIADTDNHCKKCYIRTIFAVKSVSINKLSAEKVYL